MCDTCDDVELVADLRRARVRVMSNASKASCDDGVVSFRLGLAAGGTSGDCVVVVGDTSAGASDIGEGCVCSSFEEAIFAS